MPFFSVNLNRLTRRRRVSSASKSSSSDTNTESATSAHQADEDETNHSDDQSSEAESEAASVAGDVSRADRSSPPAPPEEYPVSVQLRPAQRQPSAGRRARPVTAKLEKPKVLNASLRKEVDMSKLTREMIRKMPKTLTTSEAAPDQGATTHVAYSDYSSGDYTSSSSPSPLDAGNARATAPEDDHSALSSASGGESESEANKTKAARPSTMRLPRPARHRPIVIPTAARAPPRRTTQAIIKSYPPKQRRKNLEDFFRNPKEATPKEKEKIRIPEPCLTCGKEQNPERFHSHPVHMPKFKAAEKEKFNRTTQLRQANSKRIVTKPLPLMYKSNKKVLGKVNGSKKENNHERDRVVNSDRNSKWKSDDNLLNSTSGGHLKIQRPLKTRSADSSPGRSVDGPDKGKETANSDPEDESATSKKRAPLNSLEKQYKSSPSKSDDFSIEMYEKVEESSESVEDSPFHNPYTRQKPRNRNFNAGKNSPGQGGDRNRPLPKTTSRTAGANVMLRPSMIHAGPAEEPSDNEELDSVEETKLSDVTEEEESSDTVPLDGGGRRMAAIEEEESSRPPQSSAGPRRGGLLTCYICGREFGSRSLPIHEPKCLEKWERENAALPPELRRQQPQRPDPDLDRDEWNQHAWTASQAQLVPCWCGRTFFPERLAVHQKACKPPPGTEIKARPGSTSSSGQAARPSQGSAKPTVSCYICGREFGSRSIVIHEPQCLNKWRKENSELPPELQRPEPTKPEMVYDESGRLDRAAMEAAAWQSHLDTLVKCPTCPRTFLPDRLAKHQKGCRGDS